MIPQLSPWGSGGPTQGGAPTGGQTATPAQPTTPTPAGNQARADLYAHYIDATHDPKKKLELWQKYRELAGAADLERLGAGKDPKDELGKRRGAAVAGEKREIADDVKDLLAKKNLTEADVDKLMARKQLEHDLEMKYATNITTEGGRRGKHGSRIVWRQGELEELQTALSKVPIDQVRGSPGLREIKREDADPSGHD